MKRAVEFSLVFALCAAFPGGLVAQEDEEHEQKNHIALFIGSTQAELEHGERDNPQFTLGLDYERRLTRIVGIGGLLDVVVEGHREAIIGVPVFLHVSSLTFQIAPGGERIRDSKDWSFIMRFGALYEFEVGTMTLAPALFYDVTEEGGTWVAGINIGRGF